MPGSTQEHSLLSSPTFEEKAVALVETTMGCKVDKRSFFLDALDFVESPTPDQQVESVGWSFSEAEDGSGGLIGFGNSSTTAFTSFDFKCPGRRHLLNIDYFRSDIGMDAVKVVVHGSDTAQAVKLATSRGIKLSLLWTAYGNAKIRRWNMR